MDPVGPELVELVGLGHLIDGLDTLAEILTCLVFLVAVHVGYVVGRRQD